jgi:hypothetical protein
MLAARSVTITDRFLSATMLHCIVSARALKDARADEATDVTAAPFSPTSC